MERLKEEIKKIELTTEAQSRIIGNCAKKIKSEQEKECMKKNVGNSIRKPVMLAVAALTLCVCLTGITVLAGTGKGFFKDAIRWDGAITGQTYQNATDELLVYAAVEEDVLTVTVEMVKYEVAPYSEIEVLELQKYRVYDAYGNMVMEDVVPENVVTENNQVKFQILADNLLEGNYKLELDVLAGSKKADQVLMIYGNWECEFTK